MGVCVLRERESDRDRVGGCVGRLCERKVEGSLCLGYVKGRERETQSECVCRLGERKRERDRIGECVCYIKEERERDRVCGCVSIREK